MMRRFMFHLGVFYLLVGLFFGMINMNKRSHVSDAAWDNEVACVILQIGTLMLDLQMA